MTTVTITPLGTFRNDRPYPFCPGCGHGSILDALDAALVRRGTDPSKVVLVSDIGCSGLSDQYFRTSAFHGLHGRSITYATGIKLARPDLDVIVIMGDGGTGIGGAHLLAAARRNIGITVLVLNNLNFGMTGGQHSTTTPPDAVTATTPTGNLERPLDIAATVAVNGAQYAWRGTSFDDDLPDRIADGMDSGGFALLDIWELCTAYYVKANAYSRRAIATTMEGLGMRSGVLASATAPEFAAEYRRRAAASPLQPAGADPIPIRHRSGLDRRIGIVVGGAAGGRVRSAARLGAEAAIASGLWAAQHDDYPITVKTGHSVSTLVLSTSPVLFPGVPSPDLLVVTAAEGLAKVRSLASGMSADAVVVTTPEFADNLETAARMIVTDPGSGGQRIARADLALALLTAGLGALDAVGVDALIERAALLDARFADRTIEVIRAGAALLD